MVAHTTDEALRQSSVRYLWMHNRDWIQMAEEGEPMIAVEGNGVRIVDSEGNSWIDVNGGYNSVNVGYGRQEIADAAYEQMNRIAYFPNGTTTEPTALLARKLAEITPGSLSRVFPVSGGSEANETAIKIARAYHSRRGESSRYKIISRMGSYHGTTAGVVWLGGTPTTTRDDFEPAYPGMVYAPQPLPYLSDETPSECAIRCAEAVEELIKFEGPETVAAVIAEPVAMPMGVVVPGDEYWPMLRDICDRYGVLLIADEVINGFGRTGKMFAVEHWDVVPDIMSVAKGIISSYLPLAATIATEEVAGVFAGENDYLRHVLTSSGHPVFGGGVAEEHRDNRERKHGGKRGAGRRVLQGTGGGDDGRPPLDGRCARDRASGGYRASEGQDNKRAFRSRRPRCRPPQREFQEERPDTARGRADNQHGTASVHNDIGS